MVGKNDFRGVIGSRDGSLVGCNRSVSVSLSIYIYTCNSSTTDYIYRLSLLKRN